MFLCAYHLPLANDLKRNVVRRVDFTVIAIVVVVAVVVSVVVVNCQLLAALFTKVLNASSESFAHRC